MKHPIRIHPAIAAEEARRCRVKLGAGLSLREVDGHRLRRDPRRRSGATARSCCTASSAHAPTAKVPLLIVYALVNRPVHGRTCRTTARW